MGEPDLSLDSDPARRRGGSAGDGAICHEQWNGYRRHELRFHQPPALRVDRLQPADREQGLADAQTTLQASPRLAPMTSELGVRVFDVMHDILTRNAALAERPPSVRPADALTGE